MTIYRTLITLWIVTIPVYVLFLHRTRPTAQRERFRRLASHHRAALQTIRRATALTDAALTEPPENARACLERIGMTLAPWRARVVRGPMPAESRKAAR